MTMKLLEKAIPILAIILCIVLFTPLFGVLPAVKSALFIHLLSYLSLGLLFELPELSLNLWFLVKAQRERVTEQNFPTFKRALSVRYLLTHYIGPCTGILTVGSGLYLVYLGGYSFSSGWLFWILIAAIIGLYKGMNHHNCYIKNLINMFARCQKDDQTALKNLQQVIVSPFDQVLIFFELPTYAFIYIVAYYKPQWLANPFAGTFRALEDVVQSGAGVGVLMVISGSLLIIPLRYYMSKYSRFSTIAN